MFEDGWANPAEIVNTHDFKAYMKEVSYVSGDVRYLVRQKPFAHGGMCNVFTAWDLKLGREVAFKVLVKMPVVPGEESHLNTAKEEALKMAQIEGENPFIVTVYNYLPASGIGDVLVMRKMD